MTFTTALRALRAGWPTVLLTVVVGALAGLVVALLTSPSYVARASVYLSGADAMQEPGADAYSSTLLLSQRIGSYKELMTSAVVVGPATERAGIAPGEGEVTSSGTTGSTLVQISATAEDPDAAARLANAAAVRFGEVVGEVDRPRGTQTPAGVRSSVVAPAQPPATATRPETGLDVALGAAVGLLAAALLVVVRRVLDSTMRSADELASRTGLPVLGVLPAHDTTSGGGHGDFTEAVRTLRTRLRILEAGSGSGPAVLSLTGATPDIGTTTVVGALASAFAGGSRVLVIDADLRTPRLAEQLGLAATPGLGDVLVGTASIDAALQRGDGLDVLVAGSTPDDPSDLLTSALPAVLEALRDHYDVVLLDTSPLLAGIDAAVVARHADAAVLVCREGVTTTAQTAGAVETLVGVGARVLGAVLTHSTGSPGRRGGASPLPVGTSGSAAGRSHEHNAAATTTRGRNQVVPR